MRVDDARPAHGRPARWHCLQVRHAKGIADGKHIRIISGGKELYADDVLSKAASKVLHCMVTDILPPPRQPPPKKPPPVVQPPEQPPVDWVRVAARRPAVPPARPLLQPFLPLPWRANVALQAPSATCCVTYAALPTAGVCRVAVCPCALQLDMVDPGTVLMWIFGSILALLWLLYLFYGALDAKGGGGPRTLLV